MAKASVGSGELAILGGRAAVTLACPKWPVVGEQEQTWMAEVVRSGNWSWLGEHERAFTDDFASFIGTKHALCLSNGTVTLQCALQAVGVKPGDEVVVPGLTWGATAQAAMDVGADVVFVDIDPETYCISPQALGAAVGPKTKAVVPVHLYGCMCDMDAVMDVARKHNLKVVEDVAHQHGSRWNDVVAGSIGDVGSFSFQQSKVLTCGEGGAITCDDDEVYRTIHCLKQVGWTPDDEPGNRYGHNYRITEMQCVLLRGGLSRLAEQTRIREESAQFLAAELTRIGGPIRAAKRDPRVTRQAYYAMTLHFDPELAQRVDRGCYISALASEGIQFWTPYEPAYASKLLNLYDPQTSPIPYRDKGLPQDYANLRLPVTERVCRSTGMLLGHPHLLGGRDYISQIVEALDKVNDNLVAVRRKFEHEDAGT